MIRRGVLELHTVQRGAVAEIACAAIFSHVNSANPLTIRNAWTILTTPIDASVTPLMVDAGGHSLAVAAKFPDGRETLTSRRAC